MEEGRWRREEGGHSRYKAEQESFQMKLPGEELPDIRDGEEQLPD
jgi:hypothetical protein